ncbi:MAG: sulfoxide reductase heme-binding subunit YedZ [Alphaproteobacteria bacterium]|nr:sulfoxide reductase heme-binding subunit YedZ [Alphaproteobacteria bacterium]
MEAGASRPGRWIKPVVFIVCLMPLVILGSRAIAGNLGANPIEAVIRNLGDWALRVLLLALAVTPVRRLTGLAELARYRRMLGLFAFFYVVLHLSAYLVLDQFFDWEAIAHDIVKRRFITAGMAAFILLVPLAATSTHRMIRRLGARRWQRLHRGVYIAGSLAVLHYFFMVKADIRQPLVYAGVLATLFGVRAAYAATAHWRKASR